MSAARRRRAHTGTRDSRLDSVTAISPSSSSLRRLNLPAFGRVLPGSEPRSGTRLRGGAARVAEAYPPRVDAIFVAACVPEKAHSEADSVQGARMRTNVRLGLSVATLTVRTHVPLPRQISPPAPHARRAAPPPLAPADRGWRRPGPRRRRLGGRPARARDRGAAARRARAARGELGGETCAVHAPASGGASAGAADVPVPGPPREGRGALLDAPSRDAAEPGRIARAPAQMRAGPRAPHVTVRV